MRYLILILATLFLASCNCTKKPVERQVCSQDYSQYFMADEVDEPAVQLRGGEPKYPVRALRRRVIGRVVITGVVDIKGNLILPRIESATSRQYFEATCLQALKNYRFKPAMIGDRKVAQRIWLTFNFNI